MRNGANSRPGRRGALLLSALLAAGCNNGEPFAPTGGRVGHLSLDPASLELGVGNAFPLAVRVLDPQGRSLSPGLVTWSSSDPTVASVTQKGRVVAQASGTAYIIATAGGVADSTRVTVVSAGQSTITIVPLSLTIPVLGTATVAAVYKDAGGRTISGVPFTWTSNDPSIARVDSTGTVFGVAAGATQLRATAGSVAGHGSVTVTTAPPPGTWPNEPGSFHTVTDQPWDNMGGGLWRLLWGAAHLVTDPLAPGSPPSVLQIDFPVGFVGGSAPGTESIDFTASRQVYVGIWWMASDPWQGHVSNSNKVEYLFTPDDGSMAMIMYGPPSGPYELRVFPDWHGAWLTPNVADVPVTLGRWHRIEWLVVYGPTADPPSGIVRWWLDGVLIGDHSNVRLSSQPLFEYKLAPVWGGAEPELKTENDFLRYDHVHISVH